MQERALGIILRTRQYSETSTIVHWLTAEQGRLATIAKGARKPKSTFAGRLDLNFLAEFSFQRSSRSTLHTLREVTLLNQFASVRTEISKLQQIAYTSVLLEKCVEEDAPAPELFQLYRGFLEHVARTRSSVNSILAFELKFLKEMGLGGELHGQNPGIDKLLQVLGESDWEIIDRIKLSTSQVAEVTTYLSRQLQEHLQILPRQREAALQKR
ncbi:MAG: DNA repair protein RecO [Verrucomicrobiota bacterium]|nr:DNA repair protein RecO [Verrucomicrobiota bacterium]